MKVNFYLMHLEEKCLYIEADVNFERIDINEVDVISENLMPVMMKNIPDKRRSFKAWWKMRSIPSGRREYYNLMRAFFEIPSMQRPMVNETSLLLSLLSYGQSVTDKYWINPEKESLIPLFKFTNGAVEDYIFKPTTFADIDYYTHSFTNELDKFFLISSQRDHIKTYQTPSLNLNGNVQKYWIEEDGDFYLIKYLYSVEELNNNEFIINDFLWENYRDLARLLSPYKKDIKDFDKYADINKPFNCIKSKNFVDKDTEFIPASEIVYVSGGTGGDVYEMLAEGCDILGIRDLDYLLEVSDEIEYKFGIKEDRSFDNFGFIRDAKTRVFLRPAPLFGHSYYKYILER